MITRRAVLMVAASVALAVAGLTTLLRTHLRMPSPPPPAAIHTVFSVPSDAALETIAVAPDGRSLAYSAISPNGAIDLYVKSPGQTEPARMSLPGDQPFFSPDGRWVAAFAHGELWRSSVIDGAREKVCDAPGENAGGTWTDDGRIVFAPLGRRGLMVVPASGGSPAVLTTLSQRDMELAHGWPHAIPGGGILFTVSQRGRDPHLEVLSPANERSGRLVPAIGQAQYESTGHLVYSYLGDLYAVAFDLRESRTRGVPMVVARGVRTSAGFDQLGRSGFSLSRNGTLAWIRSSPRDRDSEIVKASYDGRVVSSLAAPAAPYQTPRISPDGRRLAVAVRSGLMTREIRAIDMAHPERILFTVQGGDNQSPAWTPDGRLSFASNRSGLQKIYVASQNGKQVAPLFSMDVSQPRNPSSWLRRPPLLAFYEIDPFRGRDVMVYRVGEAVFPIAATPANERSPVLSPDGQSIAYVSDASGRDEVYTVPIDRKSEARQVSARGGTEPVWTRGGLLYRAGDRFFGNSAVSIEGRFEKDAGANAAAYDVDAATKQLLLLRSARGPTAIEMVANWRVEPDRK